MALPDETSVPARFIVREDLVRDPRFVRLRAFDTLLECEVTLERPGELLLAGLRTATGDRHMREARALARVRHPRVTRLREIVEIDGVPNLVLDPTPGEPLDVRLGRDGRLSPEVVIRIGRDLAQAAQAVHAEGIVHRGIEPENVVIDAHDGSATLAGFTFAKPIDIAAGLSSLDHRGRADGGAAARGLPQYAAPEQLAGQPADHRVDVFGLGCLLYRCVTGGDAYPSDSLRHDPPAPAHSLDRSIPKALSEVIARCMAHSPMARYPNMLVVDDALAALQSNAATGARRVRVRGAAVAVACLGLAAAAWAISGARASTDFEDLRRDWIPPSSEWRLDDQNPVGARSSEYRGRRAVLVGIDYIGSPGFDDRRLNNAERDARAIEQKLVELGWSIRDESGDRGEVWTLTGASATRAEIARALQWARSAGPDAQVFVYLAGHGQVDRDDPGHGWFVPYDGNDREAWTLLSYPDVTRPLLNGKGESPKHVLIALDCCHSGAAIPTRGRPPYARSRSIPTSALLEQHLSRRARILMTSALSRELASDGRLGEHSPFARGFLDALQQGIAKHQPVLASEVYVSVYHAIDRVAPDQCPWRTDVHQGDVEFVFMPAAR